MTELLIVGPAPDHPDDDVPRWLGSFLVSFSDGTWERTLSSPGETFSGKRAGTLRPITDEPRNRFDNPDDVRYEDLSPVEVPADLILGHWPGQPEYAALRDAERVRLGLPRWIRNTTVRMSCDWPVGTFVQGGGHGLVLSRDGNHYRTAFVEAMSEVAGFLRGEGETIAAAELAAWEKFTTARRCPGHEYEPRGYRNGAGFCRHCNRFEIGVFPLSEVGIPCTGCGTKDYFHQDDDGQWWCRACAPTTYKFECEHGQRFSHRIFAQDCDCNGPRLLDADDMLDA